MIAVIDYGAGNLGSVYKAFKHIGTDVVVTSNAATIREAEKLVLPGVGAFAHCMSGLEAVKLTKATRDFIQSGRPFLGICVGLQMLFDESEEMGTTPGLGVIPGRVVKLRFDRTADDLRSTTESSLNTQYSIRNTSSSEPVRTLKVPHIGWNALSFREDAALFKGLSTGDRVYFVHSYYPEPADEMCVSATSEYGYRFSCAVQKDNVHATQFHPEKSGSVGLQILRNFAALPS